jgi:CO/xanthine dehydrogenase FAD-binding subunit
MKKSPLKLENKQTISGVDFENYFQPTSLKKALEIKAEYGSEITVAAGTTDLLVAYYERLHEIKNWLDLSKIDELKYIDFSEKKVKIGAMITHLALKESKALKEKLPILQAAAADVGSPQIRSRGTIGGNIVTSSPSGDLLTPLLSYQARFKLETAEKSRWVDAEDFFTGPKTNVMEPKEILTEIEVPLPENDSSGYWLKIGRRKALVISTLNFSLVLEFNNDKISRAGLALGSAAPTPIRLKKVEKRLVGKSLAELDYRELGEEVKNKIAPIDDLRGSKEYREDVALETMVNALEDIEKRRG